MNVSYNRHVSLILADIVVKPTKYADRVPLTIGYTERVMVYYKSTLDYFRQRNCSVIIRAAIKIIEPQKYVDHPYTGKNATRPDWWPWDITYKHPEHMRKEGMFSYISIF